MTFENPVFVTYVMAATLMIIKMMGQGWITVYRMMKVGGGFLNPEDAAAGLANPKPRPGQLDADDYVERSRRMHHNDLENIPAFPDRRAAVCLDPARTVGRSVVAVRFRGRPAGALLGVHHRQAARGPRHVFQHRFADRHRYGGLHIHLRNPIRSHHEDHQLPVQHEHRRDRRRHLPHQHSGAARRRRCRWVSPSTSF